MLSYQLNGDTFVVLAAARMAPLGVVHFSGKNITLVIHEFRVTLAIIFYLFIFNI